MLLLQDQAYATDGQKVKRSRAERRRAERVEGVTLGEGLAEELERVTREGVEAYCLDVGLSSLKAAMEEEVTAYCGPRGRRLGEGRRYVRYGTAPGSVVVGARRIAIQRPRVRTADGREVRLRIYDEARDGHFLEEAAMAALLSGTSQRRYGRVARAMAPAGRRVFGLSASSAGRRFIAATQRVAKAFRERPIEGTFLALFVDAVSFGGYLVAVAVGVRDDGKKAVLGIHQGDTESRAVCQELLEGMIARGLRWDGRRMLIVTDGGKGIQAAARAVFGEALVLQRCRAHRARNVTDKLPEEEREAVRRQLWRAWMTDNPDQAKARLEGLAGRLEIKGHRDAARSVRDALEDTIAVNRLGISHELARRLGTTNAIESAFSQCEALAGGRVKRWRHGGQVERWVAQGLAMAEASFHPFATAREMAELARALAKHPLPAEQPAVA
ncbi:MAG: transposase [Firmicutes bacterium]|nr:transposase [Bacillota bacterium]